jgi:hypothetical protein
MSVPDSVYSFRVYAPKRAVWIEFRRCTFCDPLWVCEARRQDGTQVNRRTLTADHLADVWRRYSAVAEVTRFSLSTDPEPSGPHLLSR